ncbi:U2 snRNP component IST3 [Entamoeba marina]
MSSYQRRQKNIQRLSDQDLKFGADEENSWHYRYRDNNEIYIGGIADELNEGDMIVVFSQYGEVIDIMMPWNKDGDQHKGFCLLKYKNPKSCALAIDNFNGIELNGKTLLVDHSESNEAHKLDEKLGNFMPKPPSTK